MRVGAILLGLLVLALSSSALVAADRPQASLDVQGTSIVQAMADLSKQCGVQIMCDTDITGTITAHFDSMDLEKLLDAVTKSNELKWQKIYMPVKPDDKPTLDQVKARADALAAVTGDPVVVYDPATGKQKVFVMQDSASPSVDPEKLGLKPIYLITKPSTETKDDKKDEKKNNLSQFTSLQDERAKLLSQMSPDERNQALQQEMLYMLQLDPAARQQMMLDQMKARSSMDPQTRQQYQQAMRDTMQALRDQGLMPQGGWGGGMGGFGGGGHGNHQHNNGGNSGQ